MILIRRQAPDLVGEEQLIALFGAGLIGSAVARAIMQEGMGRAVTLPFSWRDADRREADLASLSEMMFGTTAGSVRHIEVVWTAGRAGFAAAWADVEEELAAFESVYRFCMLLRDTFPRAQHRFHIMSSAGGLFEGQRFVEKQTAPAPRRPYGHLKLEQELRANRLSAGIIPFIYRPSSVYGVGTFGGRAGLITTLIKNAKQYSPSRIIGRLDTIRDYVLVKDIGKFVAQCIHKRAGRPESFLLASARPTAMYEVLDIVGKVIGRPLYLKIDTAPSNASHFSCRKSALPHNWFPTDLETGIRQVARQLASSIESERPIR
jgi:nucleoside-diphosphate-sugar epimerase